MTSEHEVDPHPRTEHGRVRALVLWANDNSPNLGVRALAEGSAALIRMVDPDAEISYHHHGRTDGPIQLKRVRSLVKEWATGEHGFQDWLGGFDVIVDTRSGDSFADIYGLKRHMMMTAVAEVAHRAGTPFVMGPQTIGPFETRRGRAMARRTLRTSRVVMARDPESARQAAALGRPVDLETTDVVFALEDPAPATRRDVVLNISGLLWQPGPHVDSAAYRAAVLDVYRGLVARGRRVSLLAHVLDSPHLDNDVPAVREFAREHAPEAEVIEPDDLQDVRRVVAGAELVIGSRMHACLNALSVGTPGVAMAYSRKFAPLLADIGWEHSVDLRSEADPAATVLRSVDDPHLAAQAKRTRDLARERLDVAVEALSGIVTASRP